MTSDRQPTIDGSWRLVEIAREQVAPDAPNEIRFDDGQVSGQVGVNRFSGSYTVIGDGVEFGPVASTRMAGPPELMELESRFHQALQGEHEVRLETRLVLGELVFVLEPVREAEEKP